VVSNHEGVFLQVRARYAAGMFPLRIELPGGRAWEVRAPRARLAFRAKLPGAFLFDRAAHGFRLARRAGVSCKDLLAPAAASSWLLNGGASSSALRAWLEPPRVDVLGELAEALASAPNAWATYDPSERDALARAVAVLDVGPVSLGAVTKLLAALAPESVPAMPDAALRFVLGEGAVRAPAPGTFDAQSAPLALFAPMMDAFTSAVRAHEAELVAIARDLDGPPLDPAQVLDRLLWVDSEGIRHATAPFDDRDGT
jgi:hypothetical protein